VQVGNGRPRESALLIGLVNKPHTNAQGFVSTCRDIHGSVHYFMLSFRLPHLFYSTASYISSRAKSELQVTWVWGQIYCYISTPSSTIARVYISQTVVDGNATIT